MLSDWTTPRWRLQAEPHHAGRVHTHTGRFWFWSARFKTQKQIQCSPTLTHFNLHSLYKCDRCQSEVRGRPVILLQNSVSLVQQPFVGLLVCLSAWLHKNYNRFPLNVAAGRDSAQSYCRWRSAFVEANSVSKLIKNSWWSEERVHRTLVS